MELQQRCMHGPPSSPAEFMLHPILMSEELYPDAYRI